MLHHKIETVKKEHRNEKKENGRENAPAFFELGVKKDDA